MLERTQQSLAFLNGDTELLDSMSLDKEFCSSGLELTNLSVTPAPTISIWGWVISHPIRVICDSIKEKIIFREAFVSHFMFLKGSLHCFFVIDKQMF